MMTAIVIAMIMMMVVTMVTKMHDDGDRHCYDYDDGGGGDYGDEDA